MSGYVFCVSGGSVSVGMYDVQLVPGRAYAADDELVRRYPHLFAATPIVYDHRGNVVEQATAAPGEKRTVRRGAA